jgi:hypothetical protein
MDYAGVWKPVQFSIARAFADVTLNVQHDLDDNSITVRPMGSRVCCGSQQGCSLCCALVRATCWLRVS